jgi:transposase-like protein
MAKRRSVVKTTKRRTKFVKRAKRTRNSYSVEYKKEVIAYAGNHGNNEAARHFGLNQGMVSRWISASSKWTSETKENSKRVGSGRKAFFPEAEEKLYTWIIYQRKQGLAVAYITIRNKMLEILKEPEMLVLYDNLGEDFKTSQRWILGFMKRFNLALRRRTRISQKLPDKIQEQLEKFDQFVKNLRIEKSFELGNILNMDETPVWFDMAGVYTINPKGEKTVHIRATGNEKNRFTVVLTCAAGNVFFLFFFPILLRFSDPLPVSSIPFFFNLLIIILLFLNLIML